jgi:hypothetical protein
VFKQQFALLVARVLQVSSGSAVLYGDVYTAYGQIYVNRADGSDLDAYFGGPDGVGLIGVVGNGAVLGTSLHSGYVLLTVTVDPRDPGAALSEYEDIVEVSMTTEDERFILFCWGGEETHDLSPLTAGGPTAFAITPAVWIAQAAGRGATSTIRLSTNTSCRSGLLRTRHLRC